MDERGVDARGRRNSGKKSMIQVVGVGYHKDPSSNRG